MWVYLGSESGLWTVGFYTPVGVWTPESDHASKEEAAARVSYLNGGRKAVELAELSLYAVVGVCCGIPQSVRLFQNEKACGQALAELREELGIITGLEGESENSAAWFEVGIE